MGGYSKKYLLHLHVDYDIFTTNKKQFVYAHVLSLHNIIMCWG